MIDLFTPSQGDASLTYLSQIFGNVSGVINQGGAITLLSTMFKTFNAVVLTVAVLMLVYVTIIGVIGTAHEGEFMGKKMNNIWIPIRAVLGIALLVPTGAGYCGIQIIMMWVIVQGVGAADKIWDTALVYIRTAGSPYAQVTVPSVGATQVINGLFQGLVCDASYRKSDPLKFGNYYCSGRTACPDSADAPAFKPDDTSYAMGPNGACGSISYCDQSNKGACKVADSIECVACQAQITALGDIIRTLQPIAKAFVDADYTYQDFDKNSAKSTEPNNQWQWIYSYCSSKGIDQKNCCRGGQIADLIKNLNPSAQIKSCSGLLPPADMSSSSGTDPSNASTEAVQDVYWKFATPLGPSLGTGSSFIKVAANHYIDAANQAITEYIQNKAQDTSGLDEAFATASDKGWIFAGAFYYNLANASGDNLQKALPTFAWNAPDYSTTPMKSYRNNMIASKYLTDAASGKPTSSGSSAQKSETDSLSNEALNSVKDGFDRLVSNDGGNPMIAIVVFGRLLLITAQITFVTLLVVMLVTGTLGAISPFVLGSGVTNPGTPAQILYAIFLVPALYALLAIMTSAGGLLSIYLPLIPYIVFTFGAIGWMISAVEAMVAGPLVALGVISPSGQHEIMGKAEPAIMLLFSIFLRPTLMIFGLMAAMLLAMVVVTMIGSTFNYIFKGGLVAFDPLSLILVLVAYVGLIIAALNKCFAMINLIPQQVMRWIGGQGEGVEAPMQEIKGGIDTAAGKTGGGMAGQAKATAQDKYKGLKQQEKDNAGKGISAGTK